PSCVPLRHVVIEQLSQESRIERRLPSDRAPPSTDPEQLRFAHGRPGRVQDGRAEAPQPIPPSDRLEKIHPAAINYAWEEAPMRMVLAIAALKVEMPSGRSLPLA